MVCLLAGFIGSLFNSNSINTWYKEINKPSFLPPNYLFPIVWTILFILMGISLYLIWKEYPSNKLASIAIIFFAIQLALNILWSFLFFYLRNPLLGSIEIVILWIFILLTIIKFYNINKVAAYLLIPYILWVSFATLLSISIYFLNSK